MKTRIYIGLIAILAMVFTSEVKGQAQVSVVIGSPAPVWVPVHAPVVQARYIYYPEFNFYFDTYRNQYIVADQRGWLYVNRLPRHYRHVNIQRAFGVYLDYYMDHPHRFNRQHVRMYSPRPHVHAPGPPPHARGPKGPPHRR